MRSVLDGDVGRHVELLVCMSGDDVMDDDEKR